MSGWVIKGYHTGPNTKDRGVVTREGQYLADVLDMAKQVIQAGCNEVIIIKKGARSNVEGKEVINELRLDDNTNAESVRSGDSPDGGTSRLSGS